MPRLSRRRFVFGASAAGLALASGGLLTSCQRQVPLGVEPPRKQVRLGFLALTSAEDNAVHLAALRAGLRDLGYVEGLQLTIEERFGDGREEWLDELAADLVRQRVDVLVTAST